MNEPYLWQPALHQAVFTRMGSGLITDITMTEPMEDGKCHVRFKVKMLSGNNVGEEKVFGVSEIAPMLIQRVSQSCLY